MGTAEELTFDVEGEDGSDKVRIPAALVEALSEEDEDPTMVVADVTLMAFASRAHALVHHAEGEVDPELADAEEQVLERFEERFGVSYAEATGHSH